MPNTTLEEWEEKTLGEILDKGSSALSANKLNNCQGEYPVYGASGLVSKVNFYQQDKEYLAIIKDGAGVGRVYHYETKSSVLGTLQYLHPKPNTNIRFAYYYLHSIDFSKYYQGAAIPHIYYKEYKNEKLVLPPLPEQEKIVAKLDEAFEAIDKVKANAEQNLNNAKELLNTRLNILINNLSKKYDILQLKDITTKLGDGLHGTPKFDVSGSIYFINGNNLDNGKIIIKQDTKTTTKEEYAKYKKELNERTILVSINGTVGNVAFYNNEKIILGKSACYFNLKENISKEYIKQLIQSNYFLAYASRNASEMTIKNVSLDAMRKFPVPMPPLNEQELISENINQLQEQTRQLEQIYTQKIKECDELKQSILQKAFRGEL